MYEASDTFVLTFAVLGARLLYSSQKSGLFPERKHIEIFGKAKTPDYFNQDGLNHFIVYLREDAGLEESSAKKQYKNLLWFMNWAIRIPQGPL